MLIIGTVYHFRIPVNSFKNTFSELFTHKVTPLLMNCGSTYVTHLWWEEGGGEILLSNHIFVTGLTIMGINIWLFELVGVWEGGYFLLIG